MSGRRSTSFRKGDRSEILAMYGLTSVAFVNPVPRTEDFGIVDLRCVLARETGGASYPESEFYVQVKSDRRPLHLDRRALAWVANHMSHPLMICIADKKRLRLS